MAEHAAQQTTAAPTDPPLDLSFVRTARNTSSVAVVLALVALFVTGLIYFNMPKMIEQKTSNLASATEALRGRVAGVEQNVAAQSQTLEELKNLPETVRRQVLLDSVNELSSRSQALADRIETPAQRDKLLQITTILNDVQQSLQAQ